jgi:hypothetical protein
LHHFQLRHPVYPVHPVEYFFLQSTINGIEGAAGRHAIHPASVDIVFAPCETPLSFFLRTSNSGY